MAKAAAAPRTPTAAQPEEATRTYVVTSPVLHHAAMQRYEIGDEIELTDHQAEPLLGLAVKPKEEQQQGQ